MKVLLTFAASINGKITKGGTLDVTQWTSKEDKSFYKKLLKKQEVLVRTSTTYNLSHHKAPGAHYKQIVLTRNPGKYRKEAIQGKLEFTNESPKKLINRLKTEGYKNVLLSVGSKVASLFLKDNLVDEFYLTLEPYIFGKGVTMFAEEAFYKKLKLSSIKKLNKKGTILLKFKLK